MSAESGSTLAEMLIALLIMTLCQLLAVRFLRPVDLTPYYFVGEGVRAQAAAVSSFSPGSVIAEEAEGRPVIRYNELGHVDQARTLCFKSQCLVIELAGGRIAQPQQRISAE